MFRRAWVPGPSENEATRRLIGDRRQKTHSEAPNLKRVNYKNGSFCSIIFSLKLFELSEKVDFLFFVSDGGTR